MTCNGNFQSQLILQVFLVIKYVFDFVLLLRLKVIINHGSSTAQRNLIRFVQLLVNATLHDSRRQRYIVLVVGGDGAVRELSIKTVLLITAIC